MSVYNFNEVLWLCNFGNISLVHHDHIQCIHNCCFFHRLTIFCISSSPVDQFPFQSKLTLKIWCSLVMIWKYNKPPILIYLNSMKFYLFGIYFVLSCHLSLITMYFSCHFTFIRLSAFSLFFICKKNEQYKIQGHSKDSYLNNFIIFIHILFPWW